MKIVDARGERCPLPIIKTAKALQDIKIGDSLTIFSDDPATSPDLKAWARMTGNKVEVLGPVEFKITKLVSKD